MVFAGPIELSQEEILLILGVLGLVALVLLLIGALIAWGIARRRVALPLGGLACAIGGLTVGTTLGFGFGLAAGWSASVLVGLALATDGRGRGDRPTRH